MRKWYELRSHAMHNKRLKMSKKDFEEGLLNQLTLAIEHENDKKIKAFLIGEQQRLSQEALKYQLVKKNKKEAVDEDI
jgi:hypothetical protein